MNAPGTNSQAADLAQLSATSPAWFRQAFEVPRTTHDVESGGARIRYYKWGDPSLPGVVMTHGFMAHARCWAFIAPLLAGRFCIAAFDLSGMGDSGWRDDYSVAARADEALAVARDAGFLDGHQKPALVCHSYGGSVGIEAADRYPDAFRQLIVCDMSLLAPGEAPRFEEQRKKRFEGGSRPHRIYPDFAAAQARFRLAPDQPCENDYLMEYMARHSIKTAPGGLTWKFDPAILSADDDRGPDWWASLAPRLAALSMPRAVVYGELSEMMSPEARDYIRAETDGSVPVVGIPDAYHHVMMDQPLALVSALDAILQSAK